jgi:hypothetical protein
MVVEYRLHRNNSGQKVVPTFIADGGYYVIDNKFVGITANDGTYIPKELVSLNREDLILRLTSMNPINPMTDEPLTEYEIVNQIDEFMKKDT